MTGIFDRGLICSSGIRFQIELFHPRWTGSCFQFMDILHYFPCDHEPVCVVVLFRSSCSERSLSDSVHATIQRPCSPDSHVNHSTTKSTAAASATVTGHWVAYTMRIPRIVQPIYQKFNNPHSNHHGPHRLRLCIHGCVVVAAELIRIKWLCRSSKSGSVSFHSDSPLQ